MKILWSLCGETSTSNNESLFSAFTLTWFLTEVSAKLCSKRTEKCTWLQHHPIDRAEFIRWALLICSASPKTQCLTCWAMLEEKLVLGFVSFVQGKAGQGEPERQLFWQFFFYSSAHPGSPLFCHCQFRCRSGCVHFFLLPLITLFLTCPHTGVHPNCWMQLFCHGHSKNSAFVLENKQTNSPAAIRNRRPKLNMSFITWLNPIYCWI